MDKRIKSVCNRSISDIQNEIEKEKALTVDLLQSTTDWEDMIEDFEDSFKIESEVDSGGTWKTRYLLQTKLTFNMIGCCFRSLWSFNS